MIRPTGFSLVVFGQFDIVRIGEEFKRLEVILARGVEASGLAIRRLCLIEAEAIVAAEVEAEVIDLVLICVQLMFEIRII
jgi:hypothetical protein